jgi:hypothetical protein
LKKLTIIYLAISIIPLGKSEYVNEGSLSVHLLRSSYYNPQIKELEYFTHIDFGNTQIMLPVKKVFF